MRTSKKVLALLLAVIMIVGLIPAAGANAVNDMNDVQDVSANHLTAVTALANLDIMVGDGTGNLNPQGTLTRAEAVTFVQRIATGGATPPGIVNQIFPDVNPANAAHWFAPYVAWAHSAGIVTGRPDGNFHPYDQVQIVEMAAMLLRAIGYDANNEFSQNWPTGVIATANAVGVSLFNGLTNFQYNAVARREQAAQLVFNALPVVRVVWNPMFNSYVPLGAIVGETNNRTLGFDGWGFRAPHQQTTDQATPFTVRNFEGGNLGNFEVDPSMIGHVVVAYRAGGGLTGQSTGIVAVRAVSTEITVARGTNWVNTHAALNLSSAARRNNSVDTFIVDNVVATGTFDFSATGAPNNDGQTATNTSGEPRGGGQGLFRAQDVRYIVHDNQIVSAVVNPVRTTVLTVGGTSANRTFAFNSSHGIGGTGWDASYTLVNNANTNLNETGPRLVNARWVNQDTLELLPVEVVNGRINQRTGTFAAENLGFRVGTRGLGYTGSDILAGAMTQAQRDLHVRDFGTKDGILATATLQNLFAPTYNFMINATTNRVFAALTEDDVTAGRVVGILQGFSQNTGDGQTLPGQFAHILTASGQVQRVFVGNNFVGNHAAQPVIHLTAGTDGVFNTTDFTLPANANIAFSGDNDNNGVVELGADQDLNTNNITVVGAAGEPLVGAQISANTQFVYLRDTNANNANPANWVVDNTEVGRHAGTIQGGTTIAYATRVVDGITEITHMFVFRTFVGGNLDTLYFIPAQPNGWPQVEEANNTRTVRYQAYFATTGEATTVTVTQELDADWEPGFFNLQVISGGHRLNEVENIHTWTGEQAPTGSHARIFEVEDAEWTNVAGSRTEFQLNDDTVAGPGFLVNTNTVRVNIGRYTRDLGNFNDQVTMEPDQAPAGHIFIVLVANVTNTNDGNLTAVVFLLPAEEADDDDDDDDDNGPIAPDFAALNTAIAAAALLEEADFEADEWPAFATALAAAQAVAADDEATQAEIDAALAALETAQAALVAID